MIVRGSANGDRVLIKAPECPQPRALLLPGKHTTLPDGTCRTRTAATCSGHRDG